MKKVLLVIANLGGGGAERAMAQLADALVDDGVEVHLITWAGSWAGDFYRVDSRVRRHKLSLVTPRAGLVSRLIAGLRVISALRLLIRDIAPECVLSFIDASNVLTLTAAAGLSVRVVVSERIDPRANNTLGPGWAFARWLIYRRADLVVAQTNAVASWMTRHWRVRATVIPNFLRSLPDPMVERQLCLVSIGRLVPQKAFDVSIRAFARIAQRYPDWRYAILGDGPLLEEWSTLSRRLGVSDRVRFVGLVNSVEQWLASASIAVQPSRFEGFPNAVMEAMAMGVATISTDCPSGPADLIEHMHNGILVPVGDEEGLSLAMDRLMSNAALRRSLALQAMSVRETLSRRIIMEKWQSALFVNSKTSNP
jgi:GalNAc-alpha-(1->4)-GalNAc-alpha-(1->3)-diNAcBac-PP-undecaprenol alpha-1,4-N-acetyl-D-galactosaminyltransferase